MARVNSLSMKIAALFVVALSLTFATEAYFAQRKIVVPAKAEGAYWLVKPKPWFTRQLLLSTNNRTLPKDDHDEALPTRPGYYHRTKKDQEYTRYPFVSIVVRKGRASFTTKTLNGRKFVFKGRWGTEFEKSSNIEDVPFLRGTLLTYRKGRIIKRENVYFSHAVNA